MYINLKSITFSVLAFIVVLILALLSLPFLLVFWLYKFILKNQLIQRYGNEVDIISGEDALWLKDPPENHAIINALFIFKDHLDVEVIRNTLNERLVVATDPRKPHIKVFPKMTKYPDMLLNTFVWMEYPHFDITEHVYVHPDPAPKNHTQLENMMGQLCSTPMPKDKPLWQFILIRGESDDDGDSLTYGLFRGHHSLGDGISLASMLMLKAMDVDSEPNNNITTGSTKYASGNMYTLNRLSGAILQGPAIILSRLLYPEDNNIIHGPQLTGTKFAAFSEAIDLNLVKKIKNTTKSTVNDVLVACFSSSLRDYFKKHCSLDAIPDNVLSFVAMNARPASAEMTMNNKMSIIFLELPVKEESNFKTLNILQTKMQHIKHSAEPIIGAFAVNFCMNYLPEWLGRSSVMSTCRKSSLVVTNIPGPRQQLRLGGYVMDDMVFWAPVTTNVGLGVTLFSYCDKIRFGVYADEAILSDPATLVQGFVQTIHNMAEDSNTLFKEHKSEE